MKIATFKNLAKYWRNYYSAKNFQGQDLDKKVQEKMEEHGMLPNEAKKGRNYSHWAKRKDRFYPTLVTHDTIPAAVYESREDSEGNTYVREIQFPSDELVVIPGTPIVYVMDEIKEFWKREAFFDELGLVYKRGVIFYGPAGCGKTSIIRMLANEFIATNGLVLSITDIDNDQDILLKLREVEPDRPIMCIFEDIEKLTENRETESDVLSFLDGEKQIGNVVNIATTNKPDILEDRLLKRPGRFDLVIGLNPPVEEARYVYLKRLFDKHKTEEEIKYMAEKTNGLGMAHLRELAVSMLAFGREFESTVARLRGNIKENFKMPKVGDANATTGFTIGFTKKNKD